MLAARGGPIPQLDPCSRSPQVNADLKYERVSCTPEICKQLEKRIESTAFLET